METKINPQNLKVRFDNLDPESEYYRVCPECNTPFMCEHLATIFCRRKHANDYNNRIKREKKSMQNKLANTVFKENLKFIESIANPPNIETTTVGIETQLPIQEMPSKEITPQPLSAVNTKGKNNQFLKDLLSDKQEVQVSWEWMVSSSFNFREYDSIEQLCGCERNKINYGDYSLIWVNADQVFITLQKNLL